MLLTCILKETNNMVTKTTVGEYKRFLADDTNWPDDAYMDDELIHVEGKYIQPGDFSDVELNDGDAMTIEGGFVTMPANTTKGIEERDLGSVESHFKNWRSLQKNDIVMILVDKDKVDEFKKFVKGFK